MRLRIIPNLIPPLAIAVVAGPIWYIATSHTIVTSTQARAHPTQSKAITATPKVVAEQQITPVVSQNNGQVQVSVDTKRYQHIQKVEFYVANRLIGAAYTKPYTMQVGAITATPSLSGVTAKIYTDTAVIQTKTVSYVSPSNALPTTNQSTSPPNATDTSPQTTTDESLSTQLPTPQNVAASANADGTVVTISWDAVDKAEAYQVWRDGTIVSTVADTTYNDTTVQPGTTYGYQITALSDSSSSPMSDTVSVTTPGQSVPAKNETAVPALADTTAANASNNDTSAN